MNVCERATSGQTTHCADEWVSAICEQFSTVTGWKLWYAPSDQGDSVGDAEGVESTCWQEQVHDGQEVPGRLVLGFPDDVCQDQSFETVRPLVTLVAELLGRALTATQTLETRTQELSMLIELGVSAPKEEELLSTLKQMLRASLQLTGFRSACLFLLDLRSNELRLRVTHHLEPCEVPRARRLLRELPPDLAVLMDGIPAILCRDEAGHAEWLPADASLGIGLPIQSSSGQLGTLWLFDRRQRRPTTREQRILNSLCAQIALILEQVVLVRENVTQRRLQREVQSLAESHQADRSVQTLELPKLDIAWRMSSCFELGGDLCEALALSGDELVTVVGDATGKSLPAALVMTAVRAAVHSALAGGRDAACRTADVLTRSNRALVRTGRLPHFMSLVYAVIDTRSMTLTYSNAGHPTPLVVRESSVIPLSTHDLLLGVSDEATYTSATFALEPGDVVLLFSDGIIEARNRDREMFRQEGLLKAFSAVNQKNAVTLLNQIWSRLDEFSAPGESDDRSLMIVRIR